MKLKLIMMNIKYHIIKEEEIIIVAMIVIVPVIIYILQIVVMDAVNVLVKYVQDVDIVYLQ